MTEYCGGYRQQEMVECDKEHGQCGLCFIAELEVFNEDLMNENWRMKVEIAKLKEDAERYRWMKANVRNGSFGTDTGWIDDDTEHWDDDLDLKMGITTLK